MNWEDVLVEESDENYPRPRAGHCSVAVSMTAYMVNTHLMC